LKRQRQSTYSRNCSAAHEAMMLARAIGQRIHDMCHEHKVDSQREKPRVLQREIFPVFREEYAETK
ncbi:hypothetical protein OS493_022324, partial [Desmophyllum pertusum]